MSLQVSTVEAQVKGYSGIFCHFHPFQTLIHINPVSSSSHLVVGDRTRVDLGVATEASVPSYPALPPEASSHGASVPDVNPHSQDWTLQNQTSGTDLGPERTEGGCIRVYHHHLWSQFVAKII